MDGNINTLSYWCHAPDAVQTWHETLLTDGEEEAIVRVTVARKNPNPNAGHPLEMAKWARLKADAEETLYAEHPHAFGPYLPSAE